MRQAQAPPPNDRQIPSYHEEELAPRKSRFCVLIPVINEGKRILRQLHRMRDVDPMPDVLISDGGSTDGSVNPRRLGALGVRSLLTLEEGGALSSQLRMGFAYALDQGYEGVVTVDGNDKDGVEAIPRFTTALEAGFDFIQGSRFLPGGQSRNTPLARSLAIRAIHAPLVSKRSGFRYTDTTNAFRGHSRKLLLHPGLRPFRSCFSAYELLVYISIRAPQLGMRVCEIPVSRIYPRSGKTPTKISPLVGNTRLLKTLFAAAAGRYHPPR